MEFLMFWGSKLHQITTKYQHKNAYRAIRGKSSEFLKREQTIIRIEASFPRHKVINLKKTLALFQVAIRFHPGHLPPKTLIFTLRALVE